MSSGTKQSSKDTTSEAQARFVISLPRDVGEEVDKVGAIMREAMRQQTGITFDLTRSQIVQSLIKSALEEYNGAVAADDTPAEK